MDNRIKELLDALVAVCPHHKRDIADWFQDRQCEGGWVHESDHGRMLEILDDNGVQVG